MEVEPDVVNVRVVQCLSNLSHLLANSQLTALFVNEIDEVLLLVVDLSLLHVLLCSLERLIKVSVDRHRGSPSHIRLHLPDERNRAADLQVSSKHERAIGLLVCDDVLSLAEIGCVTVTIQTTNDESSAHATCILPGDEDEGSCGVDALDRDEAVNDRNAERRVLHIHKLFEHLVIEGEFVHVVDAVGEEANKIGALRR